MRAYRRKRPAIVERPDNGYIVPFDVPEKQRQIDIAAVQIVQVDDVGRILTDAPEKRRRVKEGKEALEHRQPCEKSVNAAVCARAYAYCVGAFRISVIAAPVCRQTSDPRRDADIVYIAGDLSRASLPIYRVYL